MEKVKDTIYRQDAIDAIKNTYSLSYIEDGFNRQDAVSILENLPSAPERKNGSPVLGLLPQLRRMAMIEKIKAFGEENFCKDEKDQIYAEDAEFAVTNPWMDHTGRFELTDEEAVREWGLEVVVEFCIKAWKEMN